jgi:tRNA (adenine57-N1/adenine58-N1)-methyltransferase catalytic subunit
MTIKKILMTKSGKKFYVKDISKDYHTQFGFVTAKQLKNAVAGRSVNTNTGTELRVIVPEFIDLYKKIARGPQIIAPKDIGTIIAETGVSKTSEIVDAGGGSGALAFFLANICKKVTTYEIRKDFSDILKKNKKFLGIKNITIKNKDIYAGIAEKNLDIISLDLPEPWLVLPHASKALKPGGFLVSYSPSIPQMADLVEAVKKTDTLIHIKTKEIIERMWEIDGRKIRPHTKMLAHTGFLTFCRKV